MNIINCSLFYKNMLKMIVRYLSPETLDKLLADQEQATVTFLIPLTYILFIFSDPEYLSMMIKTSHYLKYDRPQKRKL